MSKETPDAEFLTRAAFAEWKVTDVRISAVAYREDGAASVVLGWTAEGPDGKPAGFGELTLRRLDGWDIETETLGPDFAKKVLAFIVDNGKIIE